MTTNKGTFQVRSALVLFATIAGLVIADPNDESCATKTTCHDCIQTPSCGWCFEPYFFGQNRCLHPTKKVEECREEFLYNPSNMLQLIQARHLSTNFDSGFASRYYNPSSANLRSVEISPQEINLQLRLGDSSTIQMDYTRAEDFPIDIYFLIDMAIRAQQNLEFYSSFADELSNISSNFRLGFGTFVSKSGNTATTTTESAESHQSRDNSPGFRHHMSLGSDTRLFSQTVMEIPLDEGLPVSQDGSNAIMQAIVCRNEIGWRRTSRRILLVVTNGNFPASESTTNRGSLGVNDEKCHLNNDGLYDNSASQTAPTLLQINSQIRNNFMSVIFAVPQNLIGSYKILQHNIEGASTVKLTNDSATIVQSVSENYKNISTTVTLKDTASSNLKMTYHSGCLNKTQERLTNSCDGIKVGDVITFKITMELSSCPADLKDEHQTLQIYPVGLNTSLTVNVKTLCACPCETPGDYGYEENSGRCNSHGTYKCGICECQQEYYGQRCECVKPGTTSVPVGCRPDNKTAVECSGRGACICNACECDFSLNPSQVIYGKFCECDNFSCPRHFGEICSGPQHGLCDCNQCLCKKEWIGPACECAVSFETCIAPNGSPEVCSGHGNCVCGECACTNDFFGRYCEKAEARP